MRVKRDPELVALAAQVGISELARRLGRSPKFVRRRLDPDAQRAADRRLDKGRNAYKRAWESEHDRGPCPQCGTPMSVGTHRTPGAKCVDCERGARRARREAREAIIERLYHEGASYAQIGEEIGSTAKSVNTYINAMRRQGRCLPLRRKTSHSVYG